MTETDRNETKGPQTFLASARGRRLAGLALGALVAIVAVIVVVGRDSAHNAVHFSRAAVFPGFDGKVETATGVTIADKDHIVHLRKAAPARWVVTEAHDYPASSERLRALFLDLADLQKIELKTERPDWQAALGLVSPKEGGAATLIDVTAADGKPLASLMIGTLETSGLNGKDRAFIRADGQARAYLAEGDLPLEAAPTDWLEQTIVDLPRDRVRRVALTPASGAAYTISRPTPKDANFTVEALPPGRSMVSEIAANGIGAGAINVALDDVRPVGEIDFSGASRIVFETFDGLSVLFDVVAREGIHWLRISAVSAPGAQTAAEAAALAQRTQPWAYAIPDWKANLFTKPLETLLKTEGTPTAAAPGSK